MGYREPWTEDRVDYMLGRTPGEAQQSRFSLGVLQVCEKAPMSAEADARMTAAAVH